MDKDHSLSFHNDDKETLVEVDGKLYSLQDTGMTIRDIRNKDKLPHIRHLNPIPIRSKEEQLLKNKEVDRLNLLSKQCSTTSNNITSIKRAMAVGANIPDEIQRLLKLKKEYQKKGDEQECRRIRRTLRKLDYKRYLRSNNE